MSEKTVVISQPMYFPWVGMFEQIRLADDYVDYADVAFSKGSFTNRVQVKTTAGSTWLTVPIRDVKLGQHIADISVDSRKNWQKRHRSTLAQSYARAPFLNEMLSLVDEVFSAASDSLADLSLSSMMTVCRYFELDQTFRFHRSSELGVNGSSSERVLNIVRCLGGKRYVTGHGAKNYLDHDLFEAAGISVEYMDYQKIEYPQIHPPFTPFVSILDLIANLGKEGKRVIVSQALPWREAMKQP